jgi:hypothetical protein
MARDAAQQEKQARAVKGVGEERRLCRRQVESRSETKAIVLRSAADGARAARDG